MLEITFKICGCILMATLTLGVVTLILTLLVSLVDKRQARIEKRAKCEKKGTKKHTKCEKNGGKK